MVHPTIPMIRVHVRSFVRPFVRHADRIGTGFSEKKWGFAIGAEIEYS